MTSDLNYWVNNDGVSVTVTGHVDEQSATGSLVIPETVEYSGSTYSVITIDNYAFSGCSGLTGSLTIPNSVTTIGNYAFFRCTGITEAILYRTTPPTLGGNYAFYITTWPIYVPYEALNDYKTNWSSYESRLYPMAYTTIPAHGTSNGWNFVASPLVATTNPTAIDDMIAETETDFDLYRFNQSAELEWENWKSDANNDDHYHFNLENGQGYLYANAEDVNLIFKGEFNEDETKEVALTSYFKKTFFCVKT